MKRLALCFFTLIFHSYVCTQDNMVRATQQNCEENDNDPVTAEILQVFAGVIVNFGKVIADPDNPQNVSEKVANMIAGMINIAAIMTKSIPGIREEKINEILNAMDPEIQKALEKIAKIEAVNLRRSCIKG